MLLWKTINFGAFLQTSKLTVFTLCSGISKQNQHRFVNYTNASTSCEILVKIGPVTSEFKSAKIENLPRLCCILTIIVYLARWRSEMDWNVKILISAR